MVVSYTSIVVQIYQSQKRLKQTTSSTSNNIYKKAFRNINRILATFFLTNILLFVKGVLIAIYNFNVDKEWYIYFDFVTLTFQSFGVILNPLVYFYSKEELRKEVGELYHRLLKIFYKRKATESTVEMETRKQITNK